MLRCNKELSVGDPGTGNLLVQGDNLEALKALLPYYAGKVKCIFIDPPYNTGHKDWAYNDKVDSPEMRNWLGATVGAEGEDLTRHDKWLCMMYPRLRLLQEFLSRDGIIAVSIDDNELNALGVLLDDVFGARNRLACAPWLAEPSGGKEKTGLRGGHEYLFIYHNGDDRSISREMRSTGKLDKKDRWGKYRKGRELMKWGGISLRKDRRGQWFPLRTPDGTEVWPIRNDGEEGHWRWGKDQKMVPILEDPERAHWELRPFDEGVSWRGAHERWVPYEKIRDASRSIGWSTWLDSYGYNADATRELKDIFGSKTFDTPKPTSLVQWIVSLHADDDALVLDSFAGSATTGHAVLRLNSEDGGTRRFILIEMEAEVCRNVAAERLRRVIGGYKGRKGSDVAGLGGGFRFCQLGPTLFDADGRVRDEVSFRELAQHVYFTETGEPLPTAKNGRTPLLGVHNGTAVYLLYNGVLKDKTPGGGNVLTRGVLRELPAHDGPKVVYGNACLVGPRVLRDNGITFRQVPYEIRTR